MKTHSNYITQDLSRERNLKATREKETVTYKGVPIRLSVDFSKEALQARRDRQEVFKGMKWQGPTTKITLSSNTVI